MSSLEIIKECSSYVLLHRIIKHRDATFLSLNDSVLFSVDILEYDSLSAVPRKCKKEVSARCIQELTNAMYSMVLLGIYVEMTEGLQHGEVVFDGTMDLGSKIWKTILYIGTGVKYCALKQKQLNAELLGLKSVLKKQDLP